MPTLKKSPIQTQYNHVRATGQAHKEYAGKVELLKQGHSYWGYFDYTYEPLRNAAGVVYGVICTAIDVTEQVLARQALEANEAALRNAVALAELGTWTMDVTTGVMLFSERHAALWGFDSLETTAEEALSHIVGEDRERVAQAYYGALQPGSGGRYEAEYEVVNLITKEHIIARASGQVFYDTVGNAITIAGITQDITAQRQTQAALEALVQQRTRELGETVEALNRTNKELKRSNGHLEEFAHAASHDLKEPVRKILFFTNQLKDQLSTQLKQEELRSLNRIENASLRMGTLIDDLLLYSHVSHRLHEKESVDLAEKMQWVLEDLELDIQEKCAAIHVAALPVVQGYGRQLQQLLQNIVSNALKYSKEDLSPSISITSTMAEEEGVRYHVISLQDNGIGFAQQDAEKIFKMFTRLHGRMEYSGTGVGLSIVKKVVENHNGLIRVASEPENGSTFTIYLPV